MTGLLLIIGLGLLLVAFLVLGNLSRIADAIEAQNKHYGIGADKLEGLRIINKDGET